MAMTKAEKAEQAALELRCRRLESLRMCGLEPPTPIDVARLTQTESGQIQFGWTIMGDRVVRGWSTASVHGTGGREAYEAYSSGRGSASQNADKQLFRTERDAWIVLRLAREIEFADKLIELDAKIASQS
jgi:hypothetical protein